MLFLCPLFLSVISSIFTQSTPNVDRNEWDMLMLIEQKYKVGLEIGDSDFMFNLTKKNHSFKFPAQTIFPNRILPEKLFIYFKAQPKIKSFTLLAIRDPDQRLRFLIRGFERRGQVNEFRINITLDPIANTLENSNKPFVKTVEFTVPFLYSPWTMGILLEKGKWTFYTSCDDIEKSLGYHMSSNTVPFDLELFQSGGSLYLFNDGSLGKAKDNFMGTVSEFVISNHTRLKEFMCREESVQGSGNKINFWKMKFLGNILLFNSTTSPRITKTRKRTRKTSIKSHRITFPTTASTVTTTIPSTTTTAALTPAFVNCPTSSINRMIAEKNPVPATTSIYRNVQKESTDSSDCLKFIRLNKPEKGSRGLKGEKGNQGIMGFPGLPGRDGTCSSLQCLPLTPTKGNKGDVGPPGFCSNETCKQSMPLGSKGVKGDDGFPGQKGEKGEKYKTADILSTLIPDMRNTIEDFVIKNIKLLKGETGSCNCDSGKSNDNKKTQMQTVVLNDVTELRTLSLGMGIGQMVFLIVENILLIKVDDVKNRWRIVKLDDTQSDWYITAEASNMILSHQAATNTNSQIVEVKKESDSSLKLMLIALSRPMAGDLRSVLHEPGAYSGSSYQCQKNAFNYNLGRAFYPFINTDTFDFAYMVPEKYRYQVPIVNRKNEKLAHSFQDLMKLSNQIKNPIIDFEGNSIMTSIKPPCIWIGKKPSLYETKPSTEEGLCVNWMSRKSNTTGTTIRIIMGKALLDPNYFEETSCHNHCYVLCMQIYPSVNEVNKKL